MPHFRYTATSPDGKRFEGTSQAADWKEVDLALQKRGMKLTGISEVVSGAPQVAMSTATSTSVSSTATKQQPISRPSPYKAIAAPPLQAKPRRTRTASEKDLFFLFSQIASYLKAGVNPVQCFENLSNSMATTKFGTALQDLAQAASNGQSVAQAMTVYPYLFPPHVVGAYRAGEIGGYLPQACEMLSEQANNSHRFKRWFFWLGVFVVSSVATYPAVLWGVRSLLSIWDKADAAGGNIAARQVFTESFSEQFMKTLPFALIYSGAITLAYLAWKTMRLRGLRHRLVLRAPAAGKRARLESLAVFSWNLSMLFKTGLSPKSAIEHAADSMPNLALASEMRTAAQRMQPETKLSDVAMQVSMLTPELRSIVMTGEYVGDLPGALNNVAMAHKAEFNSLDQTSRVRVGCWIALVAIASSCLFGALFQKMFYEGMFERVLGGDEATTE